LRDRVVAVDETGIRSLLKPEWILLLCAVLVTFGLMWRASSGECHHWKGRLGHVTGGFLATAGEEEYPQTGGQRTDTDARTGLRRETERVLDARPFGCF
jgi:hypothetical protein